MPPTSHSHPSRYKPLKSAEHFHLPYLFNLTISLRKVLITGKKPEVQEGQTLSKVTQPEGHPQGLEPRSPGTKSVLILQPGPPLWPLPILDAIAGFMLG